MGFWDFLRPKAKAKSSASNQHKPAPLPSVSSVKAGGKFEGDFLNLEHPYFFGQCKKSPNKKLAIAWRAPSGDEVGKQGIYLIYDVTADKVLLWGSCIKPGGASIANNGVAVIEDWHNPQALEGTLIVHDEKHEIIIQRYIRSNILTSGISANGKFAYCQTANNKDATAEGNSILFFNVEEKTELYCVGLQIGWPQKYSVDEKHGVLIGEFKGGGTVRFGRDGQHGDERDSEAMLASSDFVTVLRQAEKLVKGSDDEDELVLAAQALNRVIGTGAAREPDVIVAQAYRALGTIYELLSKEPESLSAFDLALALDAKIGVKRKADALRKKLAQG